MRNDAPNWWQVHATVTPQEAQNDKFVWATPIRGGDMAVGGVGTSADMEAPLEVVFSHEVGHVTHSKVKLGNDRVSTSAAAH